MLRLIVFGGIGVALFLAKRSADRFAAMKRAKGEWDENGPKYPTEPELKYRLPSKGRLAFVNLALEEEQDDAPVRLGERDLPGIRDLIQRILVALLDGSHPSHDALRAQAEAAQIDDIFIAPAAPKFASTYQRRCRPSHRRRSRAGSLSCDSMRYRNPHLLGQRWTAEG